MPAKRQLDVHAGREPPAPTPKRRTLEKVRPMLASDLAQMAAEVDTRAPVVKKYEEDEPDFHFCYMDPNTPNSVHRARGYEPVTSSDGEQISDGLDPLWKCPKDAFLERRSRETALSKAAITSQVEKERDSGAIPHHQYL